ncbi:hypothetical protein Spb1_05330 [Planctopirus ephydatiae]|uniref:TIGR03067 domain-containing protein n=1 Tax=Planctopirus ephydatiae TaxID=2528019 RepID=A0A518GJB6_9PLAN|nr:TIGR03067 domain-containing protein [Planctopirus ephydatiae]QDV28668.1 hypothetical protein Spb1_05330 [Planctopirus ephydatiae]
MKSGLLMVLVVGLLSSAGAAEQAAGGDAEKLQGTWKVVSSEDSGQKAPDEAIKNLKMVITKEKITYKFDNKTMEWSYKLDPTKEPRWIDIKMGGDRTTLGIYVLDEDNLKICFPEQSTERSTAFESKPNSVNDVLIILKREKP